MAIDEFDTPPHLAADLIRIAGSICECEPRVVADFAVGTGELLVAAQQRWPKASAFGCDISVDRVDHLVLAKPEWTVVRCNFLDCVSRSAVPGLESIRDRVDLVVLNPPFTARGGTRVDTTIDGEDVRCSPAMAFVLLASQYLSSGGNLVALLPAGALESERDEHARTVLQRLGKFAPIYESTITFPGGNAKVTIAYFKRHAKPPPPYTPGLRRARLSMDTDFAVFDCHGAPSQSCSVPYLGATTTVKVLRGTFQNRAVPTEQGSGIPLVHSTELQGYKMKRSQKKVPLGSRSVLGPAVLLHRVGRPRQDKIVFVPRGSTLAITDCVVALLLTDERDCVRLHRCLTEQYGLLERNYVGSGAPYITIKRIRAVLQHLGFPSEVTNWQEMVR